MLQVLFYRHKQLSSQPRGSTLHRRLPLSCKVDDLWPGGYLLLYVVADVFEQLLDIPIGVLQQGPLLPPQPQLPLLLPPLLRHRSRRPARSFRRLRLRCCSRLQRAAVRQLGHQVIPHGCQRRHQLPQQALARLEELRREVGFQGPGFTGGFGIRFRVLRKGWVTAGKVKRKGRKR